MALKRKDDSYSFFPDLDPPSHKDLVMRAAYDDSHILGDEEK